MGSEKIRRGPLFMLVEVFATRRKDFGPGNTAYKRFFGAGTLAIVSSEDAS